MRWSAAALVIVALTFLAAPALSDDTAATDLQALIDAAEPGSIITLGPGTYIGGVTIDKPLTITGTDSTVIDGGGVNTVIEITAPDVTIEGVIIRGSGASLDREDAGVSAGEARVTIRDNTFEDVLFGVFIRTAPDSVIQNNVVGAKDVFIANRGDGIRLWESERSLVEGNVIAGGRDTVFWFTDEVVVRGNEVRDGRYGLHFMYSDRAIVEDNVLSGNSVGAFMMYSRDVEIRNNVMAENFGPSGYGLGLKDMDHVTAEGNRFVGNRVGMYFDNSPYEYNAKQYITNNLFAYNRTGVLLQPSVKGNVFSSNAFIDNAEQVGVPSSGTFAGNEWSSEGTGNYWSDFAGYDGDGDGIGDVSHTVDDLYNNLTDKHPDLQFYQETPAAKAITLAATMFPVLRPRPLVEDEHPLISAPELAAVTISTTSSSSIPLLLTSSVMLIGAAVAVVLPARRRRPNTRKKATA
jgi:nitrous oxidase accessory protein